MHTTVPHTHIRHLADEEGDAALAGAGSNRFTMYALAARLEAEEHPEDFGECTDAKACALGRSATS